MYGVIYKLTNTVNGHFYIGQTKTTLAKRWSKHCSDARSGAGWVLADAIRKYGVDVFVKEVLEECADKDALNAAEVRWIAELKPAYNACAGGGGLGSPTEAVRQKIADAMKGRTFSEEHKDKISAGLQGRVLSSESRSKIKQALIGKYLRKKPITLEERQALIARNKARKIHPERHDLKALYETHNAQTRQEKIALAAKHGFESGTRQRLVGQLNPMFGTQKPEEIKQKLSEMSKGENNPYYGKKHSEEVLAKMRAAHAARPPVICPHCGVEGRSNTMKRWHFDNCRSKA